MLQMFKTATILLALMTFLTGIAYPVAVTVIAQVAFPHEANGSLFEKPKAESATTSLGAIRSIFGADLPLPRPSPTTDWEEVVQTRHRPIPL
jgi:K+-transporting ATPase ATPase C chain